MSKGSFQKVSIFGLLRGKNKNVLIELPKNHFKGLNDFEMSWAVMDYFHG